MNFALYLTSLLSTRRNSRSKIKWRYFSREYFVINTILWSRYPFLRIFIDYNLKLSLICVTLTLLKGLPELHSYTDYGTIPRICQYGDLSDLKYFNDYYIIYKHLKNSINVYKNTSKICPFTPPPPPPKKTQLENVGSIYNVYTNYLCVNNFYMIIRNYLDILIADQV